MERSLVACIIVAVTTLGLSAGPAAAQDSEAVASQDWFLALLTTSIDKSRIGTVKNVHLQREAARFQFDWGVFHFFEPHVVGDEELVTGALFTGQGRFTYSPATEIERKHLAIFVEAETLSTRFEVLYLRFSDETFEEIEGQIEWTGKKHGHPDAKKKYCEKFVRPTRVFSLLQAKQIGADPGYFYAHIGPTGSTQKPYVYTIDPLAQEEISFGQRADVDFYHRSELINSFHLAADYATGHDLAHEDKRLIDVGHYAIDAAFEKNGRIRATCVMDIVVRRGPLWSLGASLMSGVEVRSSRCSPDRAVSHLREKDSRSVQLFFEEPLTPGDSVSLEIVYEGTALKKTWDGFAVLDPAGWYPNFGRVYSTFDLVYSFPSDYQILSVGHLSESSNEGKRSTARYVVDTPVRFAAFNFGKFRTHSIQPEDDSLPPVTVYMTEEGRRLKRKVMKRVGLRQVKDPEVIVARDIADATKLFNWVFGSCPSDSISVTQVPGAHGISFPGLVHLSFAGRYNRWMEAFHGHEVAHQWWGNAVAPRTYHDYWLAEGMAEFWGDYYAGWSQKDDSVMLSMLGSSRHHLIENRHSFGEDRTPVAPLWFGTRASSSETGADYWLLIYEKGAFVLHMLRSMLLDLRTMTDEGFIELIRSFYQKYEGKEVSTDDFREHVEEHIGMDMNWFFRQWVYGTDIPTYRFGWGYTQRADGRYVVQCTVKQEQVPSDFQMYVIVKVEFPDDQYAHFRVLVDEPEERITLPPLPMEPQDVVFNDLHSVLAEVKPL